MSGWTRLTAPDERRAGLLAAELVAAGLARALARHERAVLALSGGRSPVPMLEALADVGWVSWQHVDVVQVDERLVPSLHPDRNLGLLDAHLLHRVPARALPLPVGGDAPADDADVAYGVALAGGIDVLHLGLGTDGHTASLFPDDPVVDVTDRTVAATTHAHGGHRRLTLTLPTLARAARTVLLAPGAEKADVLDRVVGGDRSLPAGRVTGPDLLAVGT